MPFKSIPILLLLLMLAINVSAQQVKGGDLSTGLVKEGREGIYLFLPVASGQASFPVLTSNVEIFRATGNERFRPAGIFRAAATSQEFERIAGKNAFQYLRRYKKLASDEAAWNYIQSHQNPNDYGLLAMNTEFLQAMGKCYVDKEVKTVAAGTVLRYKINVLGSKSLDSMLEVSIVTGKNPNITAPRLNKLVEDDSVVIIEWISPVPGNADASNGQIWRKSGNLGRFQLAGYALAIKNEQQTTITYTWREKVKTGQQYYYYLLPVTLTGMPGPVSDTASPISNNFRAMEQVGSLNAIDTVNGIFLSWPALPTADLSAAIVIERSKEPQRGYQAIDTITPRAVAYTDTRVIPGNSYHYRIRSLSIRQQLSAPTAHASAMYRAIGLLPESPENVQARAREKSISISWKKSPYPEIAGYYVYRNSDDKPEWLLVSNLVMDTVFTDNSTFSSRTIYRYAVTTVNYNQVESEFSEIAVAGILQKQVASPPSGIRAVSDGSRIMLAWNDMQQADGQVAFYNVYRKEINTGFKETTTELTPADLLQQGFVRINGDATPAATFTDINLPNGKLFAYSVTAIDNFGIEGNAFGAIIINPVELKLMPPGQVSARKIKQGIEVSWDASLQQGVRSYIIFRREPGSANAAQVGSVSGNQTSFTDLKVTPGKLYFYSVRSAGDKMSGESSIEKGVRF